MKRKMIAETKIRQDGVWLKNGDPFEATDEDAADLVSMKMARYETKDMTPKRRYNRRDMTAQ